MGIAVLHRDLLQPGEMCYGGGYYQFDYVSNRLLLTGESTDFGVPRWNWLDELHILEVYRGLRIVYVPTTRSWEDDVDISADMKIVYDQ